MFAVDEQFQIFYPNNEYKWSPPSEQEDTSIFKVINNYTLFPCQGLICYISSLMYKRNREMNFKIVILRTHSKQDIDFCLNYSTVRLETAPKSDLPYEKENAFQKDQKLRISITNEDILKILYPRNPRRVSASSIK